MKELNREELLKVLGGEGEDTGEITDPMDPDWMRCRATFYSTFY
jgi:hypothetical protein